MGVYFPIFFEYSRKAAQSVIQESPGLNESEPSGLLVSCLCVVKSSNPVAMWASS